MSIIADLHIHSPYSRATSRNLRPETLYLWAQRKGIDLVGTGDCTHPKWLEELEEKLEPAEDGLWRLKPSLAKEIDPLLPKACRAPVRFVLQGEISTIYKRGGRTRKVHHLVLLPDSASAHRLVERLDRVGNLRSDGRPILGLDSRDLLETVLEACPNALFIPAHVWTPWFSVFGSRSGFDDLEECYGDLTKHIPALETGLSSDPAMNWRWSRLDGYRLVSNSDAHSPSRLGREANILDISMSYGALREALFTGAGLLGTIEFFPEEGKYHLDGHRACGVRLRSAQTIERQGLCPGCGKPVTVGVLHRVEELADRESECTPPDAKPFVRLLPLDEVLGEILGCGATARRVEALYHQLLGKWGPELRVLMNLPVETVREARMVLLAEGLARMRDGRVLVEAGFDGQYGIIRLFRDEERDTLGGQERLLAAAYPRAASVPDPGKVSDSCAPPMERVCTATPSLPPHRTHDGNDPRAILNPHQQEAVVHSDPPLMIVAGPGTGKTLTLTHRIARLIRAGRAQPREVLAVTFTHRAAREMGERLSLLLADHPGLGEVQVLTLHAFGLRILRAHEHLLGWPTRPFVMDEETQMGLLAEALREVCPAAKARSLSSLMERISRWKQAFADDPDTETLVAQVGKAYDAKLRERGALDFDDLLRLPLIMLEEKLDVRTEVHRRTRFLFVDEFQDLSPMQLRFLRALLPPHGHLTVIGDPDQSIYGFRGTTLEHFPSFERDFPDARILRLKDNYRSTGTIVDGAMGLISHNPVLFPRTLISRREPGPPLRARAFDTDKAEAIFVAQEIDRLMGGTSHWSMHRADKTPDADGLQLSFGDVAVLYRVHTLAPSLEETLTRDGIPYQRCGDRRSVRNPTLDGLISALRWVMDPIRDEDLIRTLAIPSVGLSGETIQWLRYLAQAAPGTLWDRLSERSHPLTLAPRDLLQLQRQARSLKNVLQESRSARPAHVLLRFLSSLRIDVPEPSAVWAPVAEALRRFVAVAEAWPGDLLSLVDQWSLLCEESPYDPRSDRVSLLTVHAAKGLEFSVVFVVGCEEGLFPHAAADLQEERRLFFVAMSRARDLLYLTRAKSRRGQRRKGVVSRFLEEITPELLDTAEDEAARSRPNAPRQLKLF